jgi:alkanesulfonate monooxygenase SsuD/methylene tetrahydromethanopterin reductase-like flavin-dependent oxidoreductase (luciferase family)
MKYGFVVPWADAGDLAALAATAEQYEWDGVFMWEPVWGVDAWVSLAVAATATSSITLGTMVTPLPRRKPWELAGQVATVDRLSDGRVVLGVGLGALDTGYASFGEECDRRRRAELMDEGLDVLRGLWAGQPFRYEGTHYRVHPTEFPAIGHTVQQPGVPIWCVGALGSPRSLQRALRCDGIIPQTVDGDGARQCTLDELRAASIPAGIEVIIEGSHTEHAPAAWAAAGATWWMESLWSAVSDPDAVDASLELLRQGPPR